MSSIGKKYVMGLSGVALIGFVVAHLAGNLLIFQGSAAYNDYAAKLHSLGPFLWLAEIGLVLLFGSTSSTPTGSPRRTGPAAVGTATPSIRSRSSRRPS